MKSFNEWIQLKESEDRHMCECESTNCDHGNKNCTRTQERVLQHLFDIFRGCFYEGVVAGRVFQQCSLSRIHQRCFFFSLILGVHIMFSAATPQIQTGAGVARMSLLIANGWIPRGGMTMRTASTVFRIISSADRGRRIGRTRTVFRPSTLVCRGVPDPFRSVEWGPDVGRGFGISSPGSSSLGLDAMFLFLCPVGCILRLVRIRFV